MDSPEDDAERSQRLFEAWRSLIDWMVGDAWRAINGRAMVGALILGVCAIDTLGSLWAGKDASGTTYKAFAREYLPRGKEYPDLVYDGMRNRLVHNYSSRGFSYTDGHQEMHLLNDEYNRLVINVESFVAEVEVAAKEYFIDLCSDSTLYENFLRRTKEEGYPLLSTNPLTRDPQ